VPSRKSTGPLWDSYGIDKTVEGLIVLRFFFGRPARRRAVDDPGGCFVLSDLEPQFKGWSKPGPLPAGTAASGPPAPGETLDAISGHFRLFQLSDGHRFSTDDILTAWYGTTWCPSARTALDLGSGIGTVGMIVAWRLAGARLVTVEAQADSVALARRSARFNGVEDRYEIRQGDLRDPAVLRADETFDLITGSPPYFPTGTGVESLHPQKLACRFELRGTVADYCATAARHLAPGGFFACVFPTDPAQSARVESGAREAGLVVVRRRPVVFREGDPPLVGLFGMMRAVDLPVWFRGQTWVEPDLVIRARDGKIHPEYSAVKLSIGFPP
jgi:tRNA1(Val) A37 N6-methylase TrmN6